MKYIKYKICVLGFVALLYVCSVSTDMLQFDVPCVQICEDIFGCNLCLRVTRLATACSTVWMYVIVTLLGFWLNVLLEVLAISAYIYIYIYIASWYLTSVGYCFVWSYTFEYAGNGNVLKCKMCCIGLNSVLIWSFECGQVWCIFVNCLVFAVNWKFSSPHHDGP